MKGYKGYKGIKGVKGFKGYKGSKGATGGNGHDAGFGNHKYNWKAVKQECNRGGDGSTGSKGATGANNTTTRTDVPSDVPATNTAAGPSPDNNIKGAKGAIRTITTTGTKTSGQTNINGISTTNIQSTPSVELSFFVVDDTEN